jgi:hypothetical protein
MHVTNEEDATMGENEGLVQKYKGVRRVKSRKESVNIRSGWRRSSVVVRETQQG